MKKRKPDSSVIIGIIAVVVILSISMFLLKSSTLSITGFVTNEIVLEKETFNIDEPIRGKLTLYLKEGEFIPAESLLSLKTENQKKELSLKKALQNSPTELELKTETFYSASAGTDLGGTGEGYGFKGTRFTYPEVNFILLKGKKSIGGIIFHTQEELTGKTSKENPFTLELNQGEQVRLKKGSIKLGSKTLPDYTISIVTEKQAEKTKVTIKTEMKEVEEGYGKEFSGEPKKISLGLGQFDIRISSPGEHLIEAELKYNGAILANANQEVTINGITMEIGKEEQSQAEVGKPVAWRVPVEIKNHVNKQEDFDGKVALPRYAEKVTVRGEVSPDMVKETVGGVIKLRKPGEIINVKETSLGVELFGIIKPREEKQYEVTYFTDAPTKTETQANINGEWEKEVKVYNIAEITYTNVLTQTDIIESNSEQIKLYKEKIKPLPKPEQTPPKKKYIPITGISGKITWFPKLTGIVREKLIIETEKIDITGQAAYNLKFEDIDNNGLADKASWNIPELKDSEYFSIVVEPPKECMPFIEAARKELIE